jgi:ribonuclease D
MVRAAKTVRKRPAKRAPKRARTLPTTPVPERPRVDQIVGKPKLLEPTHPKMRKLAAEIALLQRRKETHYADQCVKMGVRLREARMRLSHGDWTKWVKEQTPLALRTAQDYVLLSLWAEQHRRAYARYRILGKAKLMRIVPLAPKQLRALRKHAVTGTKNALAKRSEKAFRDLLDRLPGKPPQPGSTEPLSKIFDRFEDRARRLARDVHALLNSRKVGPDDAKHLRRLLSELAAALETT